MSFFNELKRRNVIRVGIAYVVVAWLIMQFADVVLNNIEAPGWVFQAIMLVLGIGLPLVLVFAWAFEMTPEGLKKEKDVDRSQSITPQTGKKLNNTILVMLALAVVYLLFDKFSAPAQPGSDHFSQQTVGQATSANEKSALTPVEATSEPTISRQSIAVLPFDNRSPDANDAYFAEGIHDDLLTNLARIGSLKVISRTSVAQYKDTEKTIPIIARELGVATIMEGAVQRSGDQVRINVQLIDAQTDEHLWAEIFDRELTANNLFAIQSEISQKIAQALKAKLSPEEQQRVSDRPTESLAAYNAYLLGRQLQARRNAVSLDQAAKEFGRAVELDPEFALAWVGVADTAQLRTGYSNLNVNGSIKTREVAVAHALDLNDQLGEAHLSQAMLHSFYERFDEAEASFKRAIDLSPNYARAYQWYADFVSLWPARLRESLRLTRQAVDLDPLSSILQYEVGEKLIGLGRFDEAERQLIRLMELDPEFPPSFAGMASINGEMGRFDERILWQRRQLEANPGNINLYIDQAFTMLDLGNPEALPGIRLKIEAIDETHFSLGLVDMFDSMYGQNYRAALETGSWVNEQIGKQPFFQGFIGFLHTMSGDYPEALKAYEIAFPLLFDRTTWRAGIEQYPSEGCTIGWLMLQTGEESMGRKLIEMTIEYLENDLPNFVEHTDRFGYEACYLAMGEREKALSAFETRVAHGHAGGWWMLTRVPWFEPLRGEPRFEAAMQQIRDRVALQRENLARIDAGAGQ